MPEKDTDARPEAQPLDCKDCDGYGQYYARVGYCQSDVDAVDCETCGGTGKQPGPAESQPARHELTDECVASMSAVVSALAGLFPELEDDEEPRS